MSDAHRTSDAERGQCGDFPSCYTSRCAQGRAVRLALEARGAHLEWRGAGPNGRFSRGRGDAERQYAARVALERVGLLDAVPTCDAPAAELEDELDELAAAAV